jgi:hypothetical protein
MVSNDVPTAIIRGDIENDVGTATDQFPKFRHVADPYASYTGDPYFLPPPDGPYLGGIVDGKATFKIALTS